MGSAQPNVNGKKLSNLTILVPDLYTQNFISKYLNSLKNDDINNQEMIKYPKFLKDANRLIIRTYSILNKIMNTKRIRESSIEEIDDLLISKLRVIFENDKIKEVELKQICDTATGGTPSRNRADYYEGRIPWLKSGELNGQFISNSEENITEDALQNSNAKIFPKGTLLIALYGATVGKTGILGIDSSTNQAICALFPKPELLNRDYLHWLLKYKRRDFLNQSFGGAQPNISQRLLRTTKIPIYPLKVQNLIVSYLNSIQIKIEKTKKLQHETEEDLKELIPSILDKAFKGELV